MKQAWIKKHKADPYLDFEVVYKDDEEIHENVRMQFGYLAQYNSGAPQNAKGNKQREWPQYHAQITDQEWDDRFEQLLSLSLIDVPDNYYKDALYFTDPEDLKDIF